MWNIWNKKKNKDLLYDTENEYSPQVYYDEATRRDVYYSALVRDIVSNNRASQVMKVAFFVVVCLAFLAVCIGGIIAICLIAKKSLITGADIGVAVTGFGAILSTIIVLPTIIANHLFPKDGETARFNFIRANQSFDQHFMDNSISNVNMEEISMDEISELFNDANNEEKEQNETHLSEKET